MKLCIHIMINKCIGLLVKALKVVNSAHKTNIMNQKLVRCFLNVHQDNWIIKDTFTVFLMVFRSIKTVSKKFLKRIRIIISVNIEMKRMKKEEFICEKLGDLPFHQKVGCFDIIDRFWAFDAVALYPWAMWDEKSIYRKTETGYDFAEDVNDEFFWKFNTQMLANGSASLKTL